MQGLGSINVFRPLRRRASGQTPEPGSFEAAVAAAMNSIWGSPAPATDESESAWVGTLRALAAALDARDHYTAGHSERVSALSVAIGREMGLADDLIDVLRLGALLHDIGKVGISDAVLCKAGPLTPAEYDSVKLHPMLGVSILRSVPFLAPHLQIVEFHHEHSDGTGYPRGLRGHQVPLLARIVHVADAFDAMTTARAYRPARPPDDAIREIWRLSGLQFDTGVVQAFGRLETAGGLERTSHHEGHEDHEDHEDPKGLLRAPSGASW
jgi:putative nucleotidyltransferase with HDIG domain